MMEHAARRQVVDMAPLPFYGPPGFGTEAVWAAKPSSRMDVLP
jgi:hypothetical protein